MATNRTQAVVLIVAAGLAAAGAGWLYSRDAEIEVHALSAGPSRTVVREVPPLVLLDVPEEPPMEPELEPEDRAPAEELTEPTSPLPTLSVPVIQQVDYQPLPLDESERARKVSGFVVDLEGNPVEAHVSMVNDGGSVSISGGESGSFQFDPWTGDVVLIARTEDGRVGVLNGLQLEEGFGRSDLSITVQPGAELKLTLTGGKERARCALSQGTVLFNDFTLRNGAPSTEIVPPGLILVRLYEGSGQEKIVFAEQSVHVRAGDSENVSFELR